MSRRPDRPGRGRERLARSGTGAIAVVVALALPACTATPSAPAPGGTASVRAQAPSPTSASTPPEPVLDPAGTAEGNLGYFARIVRGVWSSPDSASGRAYVDALVTAGFDKAAMQVTDDTSTVGNPAESIQFAVRWGDECLVGQVGPSIGDPVTVVLPGLTEGGCLVGGTRPIDW